MNRLMDDYKKYMEKEKGMARNSTEAYLRDIREFQAFLNQRGSLSPEDISNTEIVAFVLHLKNLGRSTATSNRKVASLRGFFSFLQEQGRISANPCLHIKSPRVERKEIEYLSLAEVDRLLMLPETTVKGIRDRALLELLYATGIRVSEVLEANVEDLNLRVGFITCTGEFGKARIVPIGRPARAALEEYLYDARPKLLRSKKHSEKALFVNYNGERITRQGIWKMLKDYGVKAGIDKAITPQILRNSFAAHMVQNGADLKSLQELLGHEDVTATQVYLTVTKNRIKEVYDKTHPRA